MSELVSSVNSLVTGKLTGNSPNLGKSSAETIKIGGLIQEVMGKFPKARKQGIF
ncbi:MAG: hypothetical protein ACR2QH_06715 [Geminicoccaceae bacterium]